VEAVSSGNLDQALTSVPPGSREQVADAAREGFLAGFNDIATLGALLAFAGAIGALWRVRERDIDREPLEATERIPEPAAEPVAARSGVGAEARPASDRPGRAGARPLSAPSPRPGRCSRRPKFRTS
jgi:hypothetical protein